jgi:hypothetical protein
MSYDPSHRRPPRHAGRMPQVITPEEAWPALDGAAYPDGAGYRDGGQTAPDQQGVYWSAATHQKPSYQDAYPGYGDHAYRGASSAYQQTENGYHQTDDAYQQTRTAYPQTRHDYPPTSYGYAGNTNGYAGSTDAFHGNADDWGGWAADANGNGGAPDGYGGASDGFDERQDGFDGATGYQNTGYQNTGYQDTGYQDGGYQDYGYYDEPVAQDPRLMAPDAGLDPGGWRAGPSERRGLIVGAVTGFLAAGMAIGVATLAAAFVRPQASPIIAVGEAFIDRTPSGLKNFAIQRFGENDKTMLLLGMYVAIALLAMGIGILARRTATLGVVGIAAFSLFGAYVAITRPASRASDVIPSVIGGIAGVTALLWLERTSAPIARTASPRLAQHGRRAAR